MSRLEVENDGNSEIYKVEAICDNAIYVRESEGSILVLYYLVC